MDRQEWGCWASLSLWLPIRRSWNTCGEVHQLSKFTSTFMPGISAALEPAGWRGHQELLDSTAPHCPRLSLLLPCCRADPHHPAPAPQSLPHRQPPAPCPRAPDSSPSSRAAQKGGTRSLQTPHPTAPTGSMSPALGSDSFFPPPLLSGARLPRMATASL